MLVCLGEHWSLYFISAPNEHQFTKHTAVSSQLTKKPEKKQSLFWGLSLRCVSLSNLFYCTIKSVFALLHSTLSIKLRIYWKTIESKLWSHPGLGFQRWEIAFTIWEAFIKRRAQQWAFWIDRDELHHIHVNPLASKKLDWSGAWTSLPGSQAQFCLFRAVASAPSSTFPSLKWSHSGCVS